MDPLGVLNNIFICSLPPRGLLFQESVVQCFQTWHHRWLSILYVFCRLSLSIIIYTFVKILQRQYGSLSHLLCFLGLVIRASEPLGWIFLQVSEKEDKNDTSNLYVFCSFSVLGFRQDSTNTGMDTSLMSPPWLWHHEKQLSCSVDNRSYLHLLKKLLTSSFFTL